MNKEIIIDASHKKIGRLATEIAQLLRGKTTADFLPHRTTFPHVVVKNTNQLMVTPSRLRGLRYSNYSGYPSGRKETSGTTIAKKDMRELVRRVVWGMLPKNKLGREMLRRLRVYAGPEHRQQAQKPIALEV